MTSGRIATSIKNHFMTKISVMINKTRETEYDEDIDLDEYESLERATGLMTYLTEMLNLRTKLEQKNSTSDAIEQLNSRMYAIVIDIAKIYAEYCHYDKIQEMHEFIQKNLPKDFHHQSYRHH